MQASGDAGENLRDVDGAEVSRDIGKVGGGGALLQRAGELAAVVDQGAEDGEEAGGADGDVGGDGWPILVGIGGVGWCGGGGWRGHERNKNIGDGAVSRNIFRGGGLLAPGAVGLAWMTGASA